MEALRIISEEHQSLAAVLHALRYLLKAVEAGETPADPKLFAALVHYLDAYAEQRHHPKEDVLIAALQHLDPPLSPGEQTALQRLEAEHQSAPARIAALEAALARYLADAAQFSQFGAAFRDYGDFYRGHMLLEEEVLLPLAGTRLPAADRAAVDQAVGALQAAARTGEDFSALFSQLVAWAPPPLGLGSPPKDR